MSGCASGFLAALSVNGDRDWRNGEYRAVAGEITGGVSAAEGRDEVARTNTRRVDEELIELAIFHLEADNCGHGVSVVFANHQRRTGCHQRSTPLELTATCNSTKSDNAHESPFFVVTFLSIKQSISIFRWSCCCIHCDRLLTSYWRMSVCLSVCL